MVPMLTDEGYKVVGLDSDLYKGCDFGDTREMQSIPELRKDIRDVEAADLQGLDSVLHLAALSNDPLADLNPA